MARGALPDARRTRAGSGAVARTRALGGAPACRDPSREALASRAAQHSSRWKRWPISGPCRSSTATPSRPHDLQVLVRALLARARLRSGSRSLLLAFVAHRARQAEQFVHGGRVAASRRPTRACAPQQRALRSRARAGGSPSHMPPACSQSRLRAAGARAPASWAIDASHRSTLTRAT